MGNGESTVDTHNVSHRSDLHYRVQQNMPIKLPMPDPPELERRFTQVLASMDLPPDKAKLLKQYDDEKKWDLICDQERVHVKDQPSTYVNKLRTYLDPKASRSSRYIYWTMSLKRRRMLGDSSSTQVLRDLEISLRTNHIEWVREFLNEENQGLDILVDYLSFRQVVMRREQKLCRSASFHGTTSNGTISRVSYTDSPQLRRAPKVSHGLNMGEARDDVHVCILCLRAIMNNKYGFNMVISHTQAINCIALSLNHRSLRTKALVLELLAAICLVKGGHEIILAAFENFQEVCSEKRRFETLMKYFKEYEEFNIDFMVACMQFVNIVVHSVEDMNFRVHLQFEFTKLGLDDYLEKLRHTESEELLVQISAYFDNVFDVAALMEDSETKNMALEKVAELEEQLSLVTERMQEIENESMAAIVDLENRLVETQREKDEVLQEYIQIDQELASLKQAISEKEEESRKRQSMLDYKIQELESLRSTVKVSGSSDSSSTSSSPARETPPIAPPPPPPPPPPGPPPVLVGRGPPVPPPPPGGLDIPGDAMTIKKRVQTKYKLPVLNWVPLKPNQVKGTVFNELDDERLFEVIDFNFFEEQFKTGVLSHSAGEGDITPKFNKTLKKPETVILLELNRLRNIAISLRKIELTTEEIVRAINSLDLKILQLDYVETLLRMRPNEQEVKMYREYEKDRRPLSVLSDEDKFMMQLSKVERLSQKLHIMSFVGTFFENIHLITPQVHAIIAAARAVKNSKKIRKILEIILAFGNYMNSNKRGPAYGFKLQGLDLLLDLKSTDKKITLMHYLVQTIREKFPDLLNFECELMYVEKAAIVSLENILTDLHELEKGMEMTKREYEFRKDSKDTAMLKEFLSNSEDKLRKLKSDCKQAQEAYKDVVEYFGESVRTIAPTVFFSLFVRFAKAFKQAETDNDNRKKLELAAQNNNTLQEVARKNRANRKNNQLQDAVITELRNKTQKVKDKKLLPKDEVYHGALEDILLGLKNQPYRRADAVRRSQRRKQNDVRYSHAMDDLDL